MSSTRLNVIVVGCGEPKKSMGWFHLTQLLNDPGFAVLAVVEPFLLGRGASTAGGQRFAAFRDSHPELPFCSAVSELPQHPGGSCLALIAGRTSDGPTHFKAVVEWGATHIYLEKPGADNAAALEAMLRTARARGVVALVGYNKNVSSYVRSGIKRLRSALTAKEPLPQVTLEHCNAFSPGEELRGFLLGPGAEGMVHNMCCHELALAVSLFGVTLDGILRVTVDPQRTNTLDLGGGRSDFTRLHFTVGCAPQPCDGAGVPLSALGFSVDRTGGNFSRLHLDWRQSSAPHAEAFSMPDEARRQELLEAQDRDPEIRPYFLQQAPDYARLKSTFVEHILAGKPGIPDGVVGLDGALEALRLADLLAPVIKSCWEKKPYVWEPPASA